MTARYPYPSKRGALGRPKVEIPMVSADVAHRLLKSGETCAVCAVRPAAPCHCPAACAPRVCGASIESIANDLDVRPKTLKRILVAHGTDPDDRKASSRIARAAAALVLLAASLALQSIVAAKGRPSAHFLGAPMTHEEHRAREARKVEAERAYSADPLSRLGGGHGVEVESWELKGKYWWAGAPGSKWMQNEAGWVSVPATFKTSDGRRWRPLVWSIPSDPKRGVLVLEEMPR